MARSGLPVRTARPCVYALRLVLDGPTETPAGSSTDGFMALLLPYVVSPLSMTSIIVLAVTHKGWAWSALVAVVMWPPP